MDSDTLMGIGIVIMVVSVIVFVTGFFMAIFSKENRKKGVSMLVWSIIFFIVGFGTCAANFTLHGMH